MKNLKSIILLLAFPLLLSASAHKFYVSITNIEYVKEKESLQIIAKIFIDDIEAVLQERYDENIRLATRKETKKDAEYLKRYILQKIQIKVNGKPVQLDYIGREYETDIVKVYLEIEGISRLNSIEIENEVLMERFSEQQNIIHLKTPDSRRSLILEKDKSKGVLNFD